MNQIVRILASFFYMGYFPLAPGSLASIAGALIAIALSNNLPMYILAFVVITVIGFVVSGPMEKLCNQKDPSAIVIDEVAGCGIAFFMLPLSWPVVISAYFLFRAFDMFKIYPVYKLENLHGGVGIMSDDLMAGLYTNIVMQIALRLMHLI